MVDNPFQSAYKDPLTHNTQVNFRPALRPHRLVSSRE